MSAAPPPPSPPRLPEAVRVALELAPQPTLWIGDDGVILGANADAARALGRPLALLVGASWPGLCGEEPATWRERVAAAVGESRTIAARLAPREGGVAGEVTMTVRAARVWEARDEVAVCAVIHAVPGGESRLRRLFRRAPILMFAIDDEERLVDVNDAALACLGCARSELVGAPWRGLLDEGGERVWSRCLAELADAGECHDIELTLAARGRGRGAEGAPEPGEDSPFVMLLSATQEIRLSRVETLVLGVDISVRRRAARELQRALERAQSASSAKSEFLANMSHELRTPLNAILGWAQILVRGDGLGAPQRRAVTTIRRSAEHLLSLINDVLDLARVEAEQMRVHAEPIQLRRLLWRVIEMTRVRAVQKGLGFRVDLDPALPTWVESDARKLRQVLLNLLGNAIKFTDEGWVSLQVGFDRSEGDAVRFDVVDTGPGIDADGLETIFEPFVQLDPHARVGSGLGLAITHELVGLMGGVIGVESTPGHGSRFWFTLALDELSDGDLDADDRRAAEGPDGDLDVVGYHGEERHVLVVDDERDNREVLVGILEPLGFRVTAARSAEQALACLRDDIDLVIVDLVMPEIDGAELAAKVRALGDARSRVPLLAFSASVMDEKREEALRAGCDAFLAKPIKVRALLRSVASLLGLEWVLRLRGGESDDGESAAGVGAGLEADDLARAARGLGAELDLLRAAAETGKVLRARRALDALRAAHDPPVAELAAWFLLVERALAAFDLERVVELARGRE